ncbi:hypothetical protein ACOMHN_055565 [Nucella lapillus]
MLARADSSREPLLPQQDSDEDDNHFDKPLHQHEADRHIGKPLLKDHEDARHINKSLHEDQHEVDRHFRKPLQNDHHEDDRHTDEPLHKDHTMTWTQKLLLASPRLGMEFYCTFYHIYFFPILQTLGMPLDVATLHTLWSGAASILLLPFLGLFTDRGLNPTRRKTLALIVSTGLMVSGLLCVVVAMALDIVHLERRYHQGADWTRADSSSYPAADESTKFTIETNSLHSPVDERTNLTATADSLSSLMNQTAGDVFRPTSSPTTRDPVDALNSVADTDLIMNSSLTTTGTFDAPAAAAEATTKGEFLFSIPQIPFRAWLALVGFRLIDFGYDGSNSFVQSFLITCSAGQDPSSVLTVAVIAGSMGGMMSAAVGMVDFPALLHLPDYLKCGEVSIQTGMQAVTSTVVIVLGLLLSLAIGLSQLKRMAQTPPSRSESGGAKLDNIDIEGTACFTDSSHNDVQGSQLDNIDIEGTAYFKDSSHNDVQGSQLDNIDSVDTRYSSDISHNDSQASDANCDSSRESADFQDRFPPLKKQPQRFRDSGEGCPGRDETSDQSWEEEQPHEQSCLLQGQAHGSQHDEVPAGALTMRSLKIKLGLVFAAVVSAAAALTAYDCVFSDFVGKVIYGGHPNAPSGSQRLARYEDGLRMASRGELTLFGTYLAFSFFQARLLELIGCRAQFVACQLCMAVWVVGLALTASLPVFFCSMVVTGVYRACLLAVPYVVATRVTHTMAEKSKEWKSYVGLTMSGLAVCSAAGSCLIVPCVGALGILTPSLPLWLTPALAAVSAACFLAVGEDTMSH